jgi:hypothetical protein
MSSHTDLYILTLIIPCVLIELNCSFMTTINAALDTYKNIFWRQLRVLRELYKKTLNLLNYNGLQNLFMT